MTMRSKLRTILTMGQGVATGLSEEAAGSDPIVLFGQWFHEAGEAGILLPEAMTLATATPDGVPSARMVLLKGFGPTGFEFYTNYGSRKARELDDNRRAALTLHWAVLQRQVRIEGTVKRMTPDESIAYFHSRPRGSQIGAWASRQSQPLARREDLEARVKEVEERYRGQDVPLPEFWGGYRVTPSRIEFWQGRASRLHDRVVFTRSGEAWSVGRLNP